MEADSDLKPITHWTDRRLDFEYSPLRTSYVLASLPRSGSQFLAAELWKTGLLGAPCEYLHPAYDMFPMLNRLKALSQSDYIAKLMECRTSPNGVFGMNVHVDHFQKFFGVNDTLLEMLSPLTYIYVTRRNKLAQAVSMAKAYQQSSWTSRQKGSTSQLQYDRTMIDECLETLERQEHDWLRWFETRGVTPFSVVYEDAVADTAGVVQKILELVNAQNDIRRDITLPAVERQSDNTNKEWIARYQNGEGVGRPSPNESESRSALNTAGGDGRGGERDTNSSFFDRYDRFLKNASGGGGFSTAYVDATRMRRRYEAIIGQNRSLLAHQRVLDIASTDGHWCLAALDAGAASVVGIEKQPRLIDVANDIFAAYGIDRASYEFINADLFSFDVAPESFDVILCAHFSEMSDPRLLFRRLDYLRPKHVVLDTTVTLGKGPVIRFNIRLPATPNARASGAKSIMTCQPSHQLIAFMCDYFGFRWRLVDWHTLGITDWTGVHDYENERRMTYVMDRVS